MMYRFAEFELDDEARRLRRAGADIALQPLVFALIVHLVRHHRRAVSKDELLDVLWPGVPVGDGSLQRAVSVARSALDDHAHKLIRTFPGYGYGLGVGVDSNDAVSTAVSRTSDEAPPIQYAHTRDGVDIAYWTWGQGPALVYLPNLIWSHGEREWQLPAIRRWYERLGRGRRLVRLDPRGTGSSQRELDDYSLEAIQLDVGAVVEQLELGTFSMFGDINSGPVAMRYAACHPERVSHLVLWHTYASTADIRGPKMSMLESLQPLMDQDWETYTETRAHMGFGWSGGESAHEYAKLMRECVTPETARRSYDAGRLDDVTALLKHIAAPTLVLHRRDFYFWGVQVSRNLAARIPDSRLAILDGTESAPFLGDCDAVVAACDAFWHEQPGKTH